MQKTILPPTKVSYSEESATKGTVELQGCYPGYGSTLGNALRRVLLSSLEGAAVFAVKIKGVDHEFSTVDGVAEDVVRIILNLKRVRFQLLGDTESATITLNAKGEKELFAKDIKLPSDVKVMNGDQKIVTLTDKKSNIEMEIEVQRGIGYTPVEQQDNEEKELGKIAVDAIYTPVRRVNFAVENMRVGKQTDYERVKLTIETDGIVSPKDAFDKAVQILIHQFSSLVESEEEGKDE